MPIRSFLRAFPFAMLGAALLVIGVGALSAGAQAQTRDIILFADASLRDAIDEANQLFLYENAMRVVVTYGASSALAREIENGAEADVFISADPDSMDRLEQQNLIQADSRADLLGNRLVLIARADRDVALSVAPNFALAEALGDGRLAMADPASVAAGRYGRAALEALGVWESVSGRIAPAEDARAARAAVSRGEASLGIVYASDAAGDNSVKVVGAFPESSHPPITYPIGIITNSTNILATIYVQYLRSAKAWPFFEKQGFTVFQ